MPNFVWVLVIYVHHQVVKITPVIPLAIGESRGVRMRERYLFGAKKRLGGEIEKKGGGKIKGWKEAPQNFVD